ncbi:hypothetical protein FXF51_37455 [Nonomuraea sp. PA05]|uniref:hypothetical protein n=1 Tax=Nonomuraea sp. PA05 TaxID=2604466 RepID=UPI0011DBAB8A|nr:hypothetical protein [Nonomuraea sp. PA05]TYB58349.1 hypothetical protein FXF51_37455 [Nonomuraea sp. PA05]
MFRHSARRRHGGEQEFFYKPSRRRWWWQRAEACDDWEDDPASKVEEQLWRVAWWGNGWGVWPGDADPTTTPPTYATRNITRANPDAAGGWALGVVPPHPRIHVACSYQGDPTAPFR